MPTSRETRIAEGTVSAIDFFSRLIGAIESGNWHYADDKLSQLGRTLGELDQQLTRTDQPASGQPVAAYVAEHSQHYRIGRALYGTPKERATEPEIRPEVAAHVLHHFGCDSGVPTSGFKTALMAAIAQADAPNREHLAKAFPDYVAAFNLAQTTSHGTAALQKLASRD
ncbi:hypothetical protein [Nonomuraea typhae]|uniref:hypothetical protein n=1 Tax=Nonomuraea typhae TaxID=2603600 RepID=UPI0012FA8EC5|nr:hypothetical protein [Nonomuraea typhae]